MKKILIILFLLNMFIAPGFSFELFQKSAQSQVRSTLKEYVKALDSHDIEKVKPFFDKDYISSDGFNLDEMMVMLDKTYKAYKNIKYSAKIHSIKAYDNWALVQMSDKTYAKLYPTEIKEIKKEKMGILEGDSVVNIYFKKEGDSWKIAKDKVLMEQTCLRYGIARKIDMNLITPMSVKNGQEYDVSLQMNKPKDIVALASISREEIAFPPVDTKEKFRKMPQVGELERIVRANNKNLDEYAIASVGFTKVSINEEQMRAKIQVLGIAYIMKRINMENEKKNSEILVENK